MNISITQLDDEMVELTIQDFTEVISNIELEAIHGCMEEFIHEGIEKASINLDDVEDQ